MKIKFFLSLILVLLVGALTLSQANATTNSTAGPITGPTPSPTPSPITSATYILKGRVGYRFLSMLRPAANILVRAINSQTNQLTATTNTNTDGYYMFTLPGANYSINVDDTEHIDFEPNYIKVILNKNISGINFKGTWR